MKIENLKGLLDFVGKLEKSLDKLTLPEKFSINIEIPTVVSMQLATWIRERNPKFQNDMVGSMVMGSFLIKFSIRGDD